MMKLPLPFLHRGDHVPATGVTMPAVLGFLMPFLLILITGLITYFVIHTAVR